MKSFVHMLIFLLGLFILTSAIYGLVVVADAHSTSEGEQIDHLDHRVDKLQHRITVLEREQR